MKRVGIKHAVSAITAGFMLAAGGVTAMAADFPEKPIQLIVPWSPGGGSDTSMRLVADAANKSGKVKIVVVNKQGAGGAIGTRAIAAAKPDGYTIGMVGSGVIARQYSNPNANELGELQPIVFFGPDPGAVTVRSDTGFENVSDLVEYAKANPRKLRNGNDQPGGNSYIAIAVFEKELGIKTTRVPYKGYAATVAALLAGEVQMATVPVPEVIEYHKAGSVRILGISDENQHFLAPDVPTFKQQGFDVVYGSWRMIIGPPGIPKARLEFLESLLLETLSDKNFQQRANNAGFLITPMGIAKTTERLYADDEAVYPVLLQAGLVKTRRK